MIGLDSAVFYVPANTV